MAAAGPQLGPGPEPRRDTPEDVDRKSSPLRTDLHGLVPMIVFTGTRNLVGHDRVDLAAKARAADVPIELHLRHGQPCNHPRMPTPEGRQARATILRSLADRWPVSPTK